MSVNLAHNFFLGNPQIIYVIIMRKIGFFECARVLVLLFCSISDKTRVSFLCRRVWKKSLVLMTKLDRFLLSSFTGGASSVATLLLVGQCYHSSAYFSSASSSAMRSVSSETVFLSFQCRTSLWDPSDFLPSNLLFRELSIDSKQ